jgi:hypothetical protein
MKGNMIYECQQGHICFSSNEDLNTCAIVLGLCVVGLSYLSYRGWIDVKRMEMENAKDHTGECSRTGRTCTE